MPLIQWIMQNLQPQPQPPAPRPRRPIVFPPPRPSFGGGGSGSSSRVWEKYCKDLIAQGLDPVDCFKQQPGTFDHVAPDGVFPPAQPYDDDGYSPPPPGSAEDGASRFNFNQQNIQNNFYFGTPPPVQAAAATAAAGVAAQGAPRLPWPGLPAASSTATAPESATQPQTAQETPVAALQSVAQAQPQPVFLAGPQPQIDGSTVGMGVFLGVIVGGLILGGIGYLVYLQIKGNSREDELDDEEYYGEIDEDLR